jgi:hypothetical protein
MLNFEFRDINFVFMIDFVIYSIKSSRITTCKLQYFFHNSVSMILIVYHTLFQNALKTYHLKIEIYSHEKEEKKVYSAKKV